jgi:hypothetical protein
MILLNRVILACKNYALREAARVLRVDPYNSLPLLIGVWAAG